MFVHPNESQRTMNGFGDHNEVSAHLHHGLQSLIWAYTEHRNDVSAPLARRRTPLSHQDAKRALRTFMETILTGEVGTAMIIVVSSEHLT